jgi:hypothetical protein
MLPQKTPFHDHQGLSGNDMDIEDQLINGAPWDRDKRIADRMSNWVKYYSERTGEVEPEFLDSKVSITLTEKEWGKSAIVPTLNKSLRGHWSIPYKQKKKWMWIIKHYMDQDQIPKAMEKATYFLLIRSYRKRTMDKDNLYGSHKWMIDALRDSGFIYDDDSPHCALTVEQRKGTKKAGEEIKTVIERYLLTKL